MPKATPRPLGPYIIYPNLYGSIRIYPAYAKHRLAITALLGLGEAAFRNSGVAKSPAPDLPTPPSLGPQSGTALAVLSAVPFWLPQGSPFSWTEVAPAIFYPNLLEPTSLGPSNLYSRVGYT